MRQDSFNDVNYNALKQQSRFGQAKVAGTSRASPEPAAGGNNPIDRELFYDIKGNTFKNTLIPEATAQNLFTAKKMSQTGRDFGRSVSNVKVKPHYKGYVRSGQMLFNNINQMNTWDYSLPKADEVQRRGGREQHSQSVHLDDRLESVLKWDEVRKNDTKMLPGGAHSPVKHKEYMQRTIDQAQQYSPDYTLKKINHYDNTLKNLPRAVVEKYDISKLYDREFQLKGRNQEKPATFVNLGSAPGPGNRAVLYAAIPKKDSTTQLSASVGGSPRADLKVADYLDTKIGSFKDWQHYDTNMNNQLVHHKKVVNSKLYELDSRAQGIRKYGYQPLFEGDLEKKRRVEGILLDQTLGKSPEDRLPAYKKKYTPITTFVKSLHDCKVTSLHGGKHSVLRPNLNYQ